MLEPSFKIRSQSEITKKPRVVDAVAEILKREGVDFLSCYPTTPLIDVAAAIGMRPIICRQERVGVGIADGFSRITNGKKIGVFAMQYGPGAENAFQGIATAYSDSVPILLLPLGHPRERSQVFPHFSSIRTYSSITKSVEELSIPDQVGEVMRRAFSRLKNGRPGPVMVEIPWDVLEEVIPEDVLQYKPAKRSLSAGNPNEIDEASKVLLQAQNPIILAGQGVLYGEASKQLLELAELIQVPVATTVEGKSAFPEDHPLSLGTATSSNTGPVVQFLRDADIVFAIGCSLTRHFLSITIPSGKVIIHSTNDERDINKNYRADYPIIGDSKLVLQQFIRAIKNQSGENLGDKSPAEQILSVKNEWMKEWMPKLTSREVPINPYRVMWEFMQVTNPKETIVTADTGSPRMQLVPFYKSSSPRSYIGWGKSHALGTSLGLIMGAKLASPDKFCANFMGDAAFGMTGLDFETSVRNTIPITTIVLNNSSMGCEKNHLTISQERYRSRDIGGNYSEMGKSMGGYVERIEDPEEIRSAILRAKKMNEEKRPVLLEFITSQETKYSHVDPF